MGDALLLRPICQRCPAFALPGASRGGLALSSLSERGFRGLVGRRRGWGGGRCRSLCHHTAPGVYLSGTEAPGRVLLHLPFVQEES